MIYESLIDSERFFYDATSMSRSEVMIIGSEHSSTSFRNAQMKGIALKDTCCQVQVC